VKDAITVEADKAEQTQAQQHGETAQQDLFYPESPPNLP